MQKQRSNTHMVGKTIKAKSESQEKSRSSLGQDRLGSFLQYAISKDFPEIVVLSGIKPDLFLHQDHCSGLTGLSQINLISFISFPLQLFQ